MSMLLRFGSDYSIRFNLNQHLRGYQPTYLDHRCCGHNILEKLSMRPADLFPVPLDVGHEHPRADHMLQRCSCSGECSFDVAQRLHSLCIRIPDSNYTPVLVGCRSAGNVDEWSNADCSRVPYNTFPLYP